MANMRLWEWMTMGEVGAARNQIQAEVQVDTPTVTTAVIEIDIYVWGTGAVFTVWSTWPAAHLQHTVGKINQLIYCLVHQFRDDLAISSEGLPANQCRLTQRLEQSQNIA